MITSIYYNGEKLYSDLTIDGGENGWITLLGYNFTNMAGLIASASDPTTFDSITAVENFTRQSAISGKLITDYTILNDNTIVFRMPEVYTTSLISFIPFNVAGYSHSSKSLVTMYLSSTSTYIYNTPGQDTCPIYSFRFQKLYTFQGDDYFIQFGCGDDTGLSVTGLTAIAPTLSTNDNGYVELTFAESYPPYSYMLNGSAAGYTDSPILFTSLTGGEVYSIRITDAQDFSIIQTVHLSSYS